MTKNLIALTILFFLNICSVNAQKFYVEKTDNGYEQPIIDKLISENYKISFKKDSANYSIMCIVGKTGMGRAKCSVAIIDNKSGDLLFKSKEVGGQTAIWNGYANPKMVAMKKIADNYLIDLIKKINK
jgi:hypothetical protein